MNKHEVLTLLERFPDLVDSDDLIQVLYAEASSEPAGEFPGQSSGEQRAAPQSKRAGQFVSDDAPLKRPR